jgi:hypothetical protein
MKDKNRKEEPMQNIDEISWEELIELSHAERVLRFGWCICEDYGQGQLSEDCPELWNTYEE